MLIHLLLFKAVANAKTEVSRYYLNYLWWVIEPLLLLLVFYVIFGIFMKSGTQNYVAFLIVGLTFWNWFSRTINNSASSILNAKAMMLHIKLPKIFFPLEVVFTDLFKQVFVLALLIFFLTLYETGASETWLLLPIVISVQIVLTIAIAIIVSAIIPFLPDLKFAVNTGLTLLFFSSGIFFDIDTAVPEEYRKYLYLNPVAGLLKSYRQVLIAHSQPDWYYLAAVAGVSVILLLFGSWLINRFDWYYPTLAQR